jgi:glycosyltransferase involved in cell wall biosynthesis
MESSLTSLVLPAYNPGPVLDKTCRQLTRFLREAPGHWEVLFVCDGCTDGTEATLTEWSRPFGEQVRVLAYSPNRGKGYAVRRGLAAARGASRLFTDVDLAYGMEDVLRVADTLRRGAGVAIASRSLSDSRLLLPPSLIGYVHRRHVQSWIFSSLVRCLLPLRVRDTQAGLKGISEHVARRVLPQLSCDGFAFDCELLTACVYYGLPIVEVPVCVSYDDTASTTSLRSASRLLRDILRIRREWRGAPPAEVGGPLEVFGKKAA